MSNFNGQEKLNFFLGCSEQAIFTCVAFALGRLGAVVTLVTTYEHVRIPRRWGFRCKISDEIQWLGCAAEEELEGVIECLATASTNRKTGKV